MLVDASGVGGEGRRRGGRKAGGGCRGGFVIQPYLPCPGGWVRAPPPDGGTVSVQGRKGSSLSLSLSLMEQRENRRKRTADNVNGGFRHLRWDTRGRFLHGKLRKLRIAKRRAKKRETREETREREKKTAAVVEDRHWKSWERAGPGGVEDCVARDAKGPRRTSPRRQKRDRERRGKASPCLTAVRVFR